ncbi:hypothetical protein [Halorussus sp. AFM4]|uniref:hypothetical protein n=1 Tax=Halorussus sp. AFM4 TaxID=3421651 RepID=UPI003EBDA3DA
MIELLAVALMLLLTVGGGLVLYALVDAETDRRRVMDRESAERVARRDTDGGTGRPSDPGAHRDNDLDAPLNTDRGDHRGADRGNHWGDDRDDR